ncbi:MAG: SGNH/GDSL hydrolase family protein [Cyanobacteria bacterium P01_G01_bin.67]
MFLKNLISIGRQASQRVAIVGGSNSVMRRGYAKYLNEELSKTTSQSTLLKYYSLGGVPSIFSLIQQYRHNIALKSNLIFFEYCINDRHAIKIGHYSLELAGKSLEGFIRSCQRANPNCLIVILIFGINLDTYYHNHCALSELYETIAARYCLPVVNLTKLLSQKKGLSFVKSLYNDADEAHYTRPHGVKVVSQTIVNHLSQIGITNNLKLKKNFPLPTVMRPIYPENFANLAFFDNFEEGNFFTHQPKVAVFQNTVFREQHFTIYPGNSLRFLLKGRFMALFIKSDLNDGLINIDFDDQRIVASSYCPWVNKIRSQNINLITLPLRRFSASNDFAPVSISLCSEYVDNFELDYFKCEPRSKEPQKWKLSIIGIAYIGELKPYT